MEEDKFGRLWISGNQGLGYYKDNYYVHFNKFNGIQDGEYNPNSSYIDKEGFLYFGGDYGITKINNNFIVNKMEHNIKFIYLYDLNNNKSIDLLSKNKITLNSESRSFYIGFSKLNFDYEQNHYAIKINDNEWISTKENREVVFWNMKKGTYEISVKYYLKDGSLSKNEDRIIIIIEPKFYESNLALFIYFLSILSIISFLINTNNNNKKLDLEEKINILSMLLLNGEDFNVQVSNFFDLINKLYYIEKMEFYLYNSKNNENYYFLYENGKCIKKDFLLNKINQTLNTNTIFSEKHNFLSANLILKNIEISKIENIKIQTFLERAVLHFESALINKENIEKANIDELTGLYNRRQLKIILNNFAYEKINYSTILVDVDFFKVINDKYGHDIGDFILKELGIFFKEKENLFSIRYGGEEFLLISKETRYKTLMDIGENIRKEVEEKIFKKEDLELKITLSIGIAIGTSKLFGEDLIKKADKALYYSKNNGRNQVNIK